MPSSYSGMPVFFGKMAPRQQCWILREICRELFHPHCPCSCALLHVRVELIHNIKNYVLQRCACPPHHFALLYPQVGAVPITPPQPCRRIRDHSLQKSTLHLLHQKKGRIQSFRQIPHNDLRCCVDSGDLIFLSCGPTWAPPTCPQVATKIAR